MNRLRRVFRPAAHVSVLPAEQVRLLAAWRKEPSDDKLQALLLTVNAIAMGQKMTG